MAKLVNTHSHHLRQRCNIHVFNGSYIALAVSGISPALYFYPQQQITRTI